MRNLGNIGLVVVVILVFVIGGGIVATILFSIWIIAAIINLLKMQRPPTVKEFFNL